MPVIDFQTKDYQVKRAKVSFKSITGSESQLVVFKYDAGEKTDHSHVAEQIGLVLSGEGELFIEDKVYSLTPGVAYHIPSDARHGFTVTAKEGLELVESYTPAKPENMMN